MMKKYILCMIAMALGLVSCYTTNGLNNDPTADASQDAITVQLSAEDISYAPSATPTRYIMEVYSDDTYTTPLNIFDAAGAAGNTHNQASITTNTGTGKFNVIFDRTQNYYCLFWADATDGATAYNTTSLKAVALNANQNPAEAWAGKTTILATKTTDATQTVVLKRAVAKVNFMETAFVPANSTIKFTYDQPSLFNVVDGTLGVTGSAITTTQRTETITLANDVNGVGTPAPLNTETYYILAPSASQQVIDIAFDVASDGQNEKFTVSNIPFQANRATNIKGAYLGAAVELFNVNVDNSWENPDNEYDKPIGAVGDFYFADGTFSKSNASNTAIGRVFTTTDDGVHGKVVSLDEASKTWGLTSTTTRATNTTDGLVNMSTIAGLDSDFSDYPAFAWVHAKNVATDASFSTTAYQAGAKGVWYLPAKDELFLIATSTYNLGIIIDYENIDNNYYWSSSENDFSFGWSYSFFDCMEKYESKLENYKLRAVLAF